MPSGVVKLIGVLLLVGSIGVIGVQACTTKDPRSFSSAPKTTSSAVTVPAGSAIPAHAKAAAPKAARAHG
jgi:hypothetical protein